MKKVVICLLALTIALTLAVSTKSKDTIIVCSTCEQDRNDMFQQKLNEEFPQYNVVVMYMSTGKLSTKIAVEGKKSDVDIAISIETGYLNKIKDNLSDIGGISKLNYLDGLAPQDNGNRWVTWDRLSGAIIVNNEVLKKHGLEAPKTYEDLLKPEYKNLIAMPDPKSSGTGYCFYKSWVNLWGDQGALDYVDKLQKNIKQFTESGSGPIKMLIQGEIAIGLGMTHTAVNEINKGMDFSVIFPPEGSPYSIEGAVVIDGKRDKKGVDEVFDFIANELILEDFNSFSPAQVIENQKTSVKNFPENIKYADMTGIDDTAEKERLLSLWKY